MPPPGMNRGIWEYGQANGWACVSLSRDERAGSMRRGQASAACALGEAGMRSCVRRETLTLANRIAAGCASGHVCAMGDTARHILLVTSV
eukprot:1584284-Prymnesium_polylepis.1